ncbi:MAG: tetratricopeptide repeat protein [Candidatus Cloacimonetes bacterium]|nr:tetratricopeptide repeat protein [Candidatus Cloacimonadota bacterium]
MLPSRRPCPKHSSGKTYFATKNYEVAEKFCQKALKIAKKEGWKREEAEAYEGLAYVYQTTSDSPKAIRAFSKAAKIFKEVKMHQRSKEMLEKARLPKTGTVGQSRLLQ